MRNEMQTYHRVVMIRCHDILTSIRRQLAVEDALGKYHGVYSKSQLLGMAIRLYLRDVYYLESAAGLDTDEALYVLAHRILTRMTTPRNSTEYTRVIAQMYNHESVYDKILVIGDNVMLCYRQ